MKLRDIFDLLVREGVQADLRPLKQIQGQQRRLKKEYQLLPEKKRKFFDKERLSNPYSDSRVLSGDPDLDVTQILVGIDIGVGELLVANQLRQSGIAVDAVLSHHPLGKALAGLTDVMGIQTDILIKQGVKDAAAKGLMERRIGEVARRLHGQNHEQVVDAARLLGIPLLCCHTPADNHVASYLQTLMERRHPKKLEDVVELLLKEPEYQEAALRGAGPHILAGEPDDKAGRILVDMTGGAEGSKETFARLSQLGINTLLIMHYSEGHYQKVKNEYLNVVNAGHIASDTLGINLILDKLERQAQLQVLECSGFRRFKRYGTHP